MSDLNEMKKRLEAIQKQINFVTDSNEILKDGSPADVIESGLKITDEYKGKLQREFDALSDLVKIAEMREEETTDDSGQN